MGWAYDTLIAFLANCGPFGYNSRDPPIRRSANIRRHPDIRRSKSLGMAGKLHSLPGMNMAAFPDKAVIALLSQTTALPGHTPTDHLLITY